MTKVYLIGSLRNPEVPKLASLIRTQGYDVFDDWYAAGPNADDHWRDYEVSRGHNFVQALDGFSADHVFQFDLKHLNSADVGVLILPAGKSGHLELGYLIGQGKPGFILLDDQPERFDVMYKFANVIQTPSELLESLATLHLSPHLGAKYSDVSNLPIISQHLYS